MFKLVHACLRSPKVVPNPVLITIGYLSGNKKHPFDSIYFYDKDDTAKVLSKDQISLLLSEVFQERLFFIIWIR